MKKVGVYLGIFVFFLVLLGIIVNAAYPLQNHPWYEVIPGVSILPNVGQGDGFITVANYSNGSIFVIDNTDNNSLSSKRNVGLTVKARGTYASAIEAELNSVAAGSAGQVFGVKSKATRNSASGQAWGIRGYGSGYNGWGVYGEGNTPPLPDSTSAMAIGVEGYAQKNSPTTGLAIGVKGTVHKQLLLSNTSDYFSAAKQYKAVVAEGGSGLFITGPATPGLPPGSSLPNYNRGAYAYSTVGDVYACSENMTYELNCTEVCRQHGGSVCIGALFNACVIWVQGLYPPPDPTRPEPVDGEGKPLPWVSDNYPVAITCWRNDTAPFPNMTMNDLYLYGVWNCDSKCQHIGRTESGILACHCIPPYVP